MYCESIITEIVRQHEKGKLFVLPSHKDVKDDPYVTLKMYTHSSNIIYFIAKNTLYVVGYKPSTRSGNEVKVYKPKDPDSKQNKPRNTENPKITLNRETRLRQLETHFANIPIFEGKKLKVAKISFQDTYINLQQSGPKREDIPLGKHQLIEALHILCNENAKPSKITKALVILLEMVSEILRFLNMKELLRSHYPHGRAPDANLVALQNNWSKLSKLLLRNLVLGEDFKVTIGNTELLLATSSTRPPTLFTQF